MSRVALALSPHLDDAVFSCGGLLALLTDRGWRVVMATAFTRSIHPAAGFALACQLDKGLPADLDYMALRRAEDAAAARVLGVETRWLDLPEAPHRGYDSAGALFGPPRADDTIAADLAPMIDHLLEELRPDLVLAPQGLGRHIDHRRLIEALPDTTNHLTLAFWRDSPYAIRDPAAHPFDGVGGREGRVAIAAGLERKLESACCYRSQLGFQFGGPTGAAEALRAFALAEGLGQPGERFLCTRTEIDTLLNI